MLFIKEHFYCKYKTTNVKYEHAWNKWFIPFTNPVNPSAENKH